MTEFWTMERIDTLRTMRAANATAVQIGLALGCSKNAVLGKLDRLGLNTSAVPRVWTAEKDAELRRLHAEDYSFEDIGAALGLTRKAVANRAALLGLPRRPRHFRPNNNTCQIVSIFSTRSVTPRKPRAFKPRLVVTLEEPSKDLAANILDVTGCRWAITPHDADKGSHMFCNHPTEANEITGHPRPYCPYHAEMNRQRPVPKAAVKRFIIPTALLRVVA